MTRRFLFLALAVVLFCPSCREEGPAVLLPIELEPESLGTAPPRWPRPRVVVLIVVDTLRADALGVYGRDPSWTPFLDELASRSFVFDRAIATSSWTRPSVASLLTSRYPSALGIAGRDGALAEAYLTLPEILGASEEWERFGLYTNGNTSPELGFAQGFDVYRVPEKKRGYPGEREMYVAEGVTAAALARAKAFAERGGGNRSLFLFLHYSDPHDPYLPHPELVREGDSVGRFDGSRADLRLLDAEHGAGRATPADLRAIMRLYEGEVRYVDQSIGELVQGLADLGLFRATLLILVSDHGEGLWDHGGRNHGIDLYEEQIRTPLILHYPGMDERSAGRIAWPVSGIDVAPTVLGALGIPAPPDFQGRDLEPLTRGVAGPEAFRFVFSELSLDGREMSSLREGDIKLVRDHEKEALLGPLARAELYDLRADEAEGNNLASLVFPDAGERRLRQASSRFRALLAERARGTLEVAPEDLSDETRRNLEAMGYLEPAAPDPAEPRSQ